MASRTHREMAMAVAMAEVFSKQLKAYYIEHKPKSKRIIPLLDDVSQAAEEQLIYFRKDLTVKDVALKISKKIDAFNDTTGNKMEKKEAVGLIIGQLAERICEMTEKGSTSGNIGRLESVLRPMERLYDYFEEVDKRDFNEEAGNAFRAWEAA